MKAYKLHCEDDDHGATIVFAKTGRDARKQAGWPDGCDCDFMERRIHRAPEFDGLSPGPVTIAQYLERGWYWMCGGCDRQCWSDDSPLIIGDHVYCSRRCAEQELAMIVREGLSHESFVRIRRELESFFSKEIA